MDTPKHAQRAGKPIDGIAEPGLKILKAHDWPGNVRELENAIERAIVLTKESMLAAHLFSVLGSAPSPSLDEYPTTTLHDTVAWVEREAIQRALRSAGGVKKTAAETLGISQRALSHYLSKHQIG